MSSCLGLCTVSQCHPKLPITVNNLVMSSKRTPRPPLHWHHHPVPPTSLAGAASSLTPLQVVPDYNHHLHSHSHSHSHPQHNHNHHHHHHHHLTIPMPHPNPSGPQPTTLPSANPFSPSAHAHSTRSVTEIIPRLYISDLSFAENPACLSSHRITHILSALPESIYIPPATLLHPHPPPTRLQVRIEDFPFAELAAHLPETTSWIADALGQNSNAKVLVHCVEGISRSVSIVAAYLMAQYGWSPNEAVEYIKTKRVVAEPNFGFVQQLHEYARDSLGKTGL